MKVLLTGASGFVGSHVLAELQAKSVAVVVCGRSEKTLPDNVEFYSCNLLDAHAVEALCRKVQATHLLHLAWGINGSESYWTSSANLLWLRSSQELFQYFYQAGGVRAVGVGTGVEYSPVQSPRSELTTPTVPNTLYGRAKLACCNALQVQAETLQASAAWARLFYLLGPGENAQRVLPAAIRFLKGRGEFSCWAPDACFDYLDVRDCAKALVALLFSEYVGPLNIASGVGRSMRDILQELATIAHQPNAFHYPQASDEPVVIADVALLRQQLGFSPSYSFTQSLSDCFEGN